ncbi:hypothetical protein AQI95_10540 [Streptomyces yokosukanensis]|uniref:Uncharacterized protein n=1 Tax=Streptomyces yokosukanensis TaxID=67386 RepID=A0A101P9M6_9ACTN|nr:hypothetical protein AQI95_10540 [Streptomyces yokosukanensis]
MAIAIATPVLFAAVGMTGASATAGHNPRTEGAVGHPFPGGDGKREGQKAESAHGGAKRSADAEEEPEEGLLGTIAGELFDRVSATR